jgi:hypothetical protein
MGRTVSVTAKVTEKKAPTDESARLLKDLEREALNNIVSRMRLEDNVFGEVVVLQQPLNMDVMICFKLNGKQYKVVIDERTLRLAKGNPYCYAQALFDEMSKVIAEEILINYSKNM